MTKIKIKEEDFFDDIYNFVNNEMLEPIPDEELVAKICARTGLDEEDSKYLVTYFFKLIRNLLLEGEVISIKNIGKMYIFPYIGGRGKRLRVKIDKKKSVKKNLNNKDTNGN